MASDIPSGCSWCGEKIPEGERRSHRCEEMPSFAKSNRCPMCGVEYDSYLDHLNQDH